MSDLFFEKEYIRKNFTHHTFPKGEYDSCTFKECNFEGLHISNYMFLECEFYDCNLTNTHFGGTTLQEVHFTNCKLLGSDFSVCNPFMLRVRFRKSILNLSNFATLDLKNTSFLECNLTEVDFTQTNLTATDFSESNLNNAIFKKTILEKANFKTASHFKINPDQNNVKGAFFDRGNLSGLLSHLGIHIE